jgi:hypothetical protein
VVLRTLKYLSMGHQTTVYAMYLKLPTVS